MENQESEHPMTLDLCPLGHSSSVTALAWAMGRCSTDSSGASMAGAIGARSPSVREGCAPRIIGDLPDENFHVDRNDMDELEHRSGTVSRVNVEPNVYGP